MDPNAALAELRRLIDGPTPEIDSFDDLIDKITPVWQGLDQWLSAGGFLPDDWARLHGRGL